MENLAARAGKSMGGINDALGKASLAATGAALALGGLAVAAGKMAMDAVESENLFAESMGDMQASAREFSEDMRKQFGLNAYEIRKQVGTWNVMLGSMGLGKDAAFDMAKGLNQLAYDMASFRNLKPEEAFEKLRSGISGESEPLKQLGILVNETTVKQYALKQGLIEVGQEMSEAQKVVARYGLILQSTSKDQGDLARTMDSPANQLRRLQEEIKQTGIEFGQSLMPAAQAVLGWLNTQGLPIARAELGKLQSAWNAMSDDAKRGLIVTGALMVAGGPVLKAVTGLTQAIYGIGHAFNFAIAKALGLGLAVASAGAAGEAALYSLTYGADKFAERFKSNMGNIGNIVLGNIEQIAALATGDEALIATSNRLFLVKERLHNMEGEIAQAAKDKQSAEEQYQRALSGKGAFGRQMEFAEIYKAQSEATAAINRASERGNELAEERVGLEQELSDLQGRIGGEAFTAATSSIGQYTKGIQDAVTEAMGLNQTLSTTSGAMKQQQADIDNVRKAWDAADKGIVNTKQLAKLNGELAEASGKANASIVRLSEDYVEAMGEMQDGNLKALRNIASQEAEAGKRYGEQIKERTATYNQALGEMQASHAKQLASISEDEAKANSRYAEQMAERTTTYNDALAEIQSSHAEKLADMAAAQSEANTRYAGQMAERRAAWLETVNEMKASHAEAIATIQARMAAMNAQFVLDAAERAKKNAEEVAKAPDAFRSRKDAAKRRIEDIKQAIAEEEARGGERDTHLIEDLQKRLREEEAILQERYNVYLSRLRQEQVDAEKAAKDKQAKELAALRQRIADEQVEYDKKYAKQLADYNKDTGSYLKSLNEQQAKFAKKRIAEDAEFATRGAKLKAEFDKDSANYFKSLTEQQAGFVKKRAEEDAEFATRGAKLKAEFDKDSANYLKALTEQKDEFVKKRAEELAELDDSIAKRKRKYDEDVVNVRAAEAEKLKAVRERLSEIDRITGAGGSLQGTGGTGAAAGSASVAPVGSVPASIRGLGPGLSSVTNGGGGAMNVTVNVSGSVIAERDLAEMVRTELISLKLRNKTSGV